MASGGVYSPVPVITAEVDISAYRLSKGTKSLFLSPV